MSAHGAAFALVRQQEARRRRPVNSLAPARRLRTARGAAVSGQAAQRTEGTR